MRTLKAVKARVPSVPICTRFEIADPGRRLLASPVEYPRAYMMRPMSQSSNLGKWHLIYTKTVVRKCSAGLGCKYPLARGWYPMNDIWLDLAMV